MKLRIIGPSRQPLEARAGSRVNVTAIYARVGARYVTGRGTETVLIRDVRDADTGVLLADHLWFNRGRIWRNIGLIPGDAIVFSARPIEYRTGYWGPNEVRQIEAPARREYRLTPPEGLRVISREQCERGEAA